jgi:ribonucleoside-diphosphate reductase alpha chain
MFRQALPQRRAAETFELRHGQQTVTVTTGYYADGTLGEVFVSAPKAGSSMEAIARDAAVLLSIAIQHDGSASSIIGKVVDRLVREEPCA